MAPISADMPVGLPFSSKIHLPAGFICHFFGIAILPFLSYNLHRFLRRKVIRDGLPHQKVDYDTTLVARQLSVFNVLVAVFVIAYPFVVNVKTADYDRLLALLDMAVTVAWACVCWIPLELHSHHYADWEKLDLEKGYTYGPDEYRDDVDAHDQDLLVLRITELV